MNAMNGVVFDCQRGTCDGLIAVDAPGHQFADHGVIMALHFHGTIQTAVNAQVLTSRFIVIANYSGRRHKIVGRIFSINATFDGMTLLSNLLLVHPEGMTFGDKNLLFNQIKSRHHFRYRMLHLDTGVHFEKIKIQLRVNQKLNGAGTLVADSFAELCGGFTHFGSRDSIEGRRWRFFNDFLVAALDGTFPFKKMHHLPMLVG